MYVSACPKRAPNVHANLGRAQSQAQCWAQTWAQSQAKGLCSFSLFLSLCVEVAEGTETYGLRYCPRTRLSTSSRELFLNKHRWPGPMFDFYITRGTLATPEPPGFFLDREKVAGHRTRKTFYFCVVHGHRASYRDSLLPGRCRLPAEHLSVQRDTHCAISGYRATCLMLFVFGDADVAAGFGIIRGNRTVEGMRWNSGMLEISLVVVLDFFFVGPYQWFWWFSLWDEMGGLNGRFVGDGSDSNCIDTIHALFGGLLYVFNLSVFRIIPVELLFLMYTYNLYISLFIFTMQAVRFISCQNSYHFLPLLYISRNGARKKILGTYNKSPNSLCLFILFNSSYNFKLSCPAKWLELLLNHSTSNAIFLTTEFQTFKRSQI